MEIDIRQLTGIVMVVFGIGALLALGLLAYLTPSPGSDTAGGGELRQVRPQVRYRSGGSHHSGETAARRAYTCHHRCGERRQDTVTIPAYATVAGWDSMPTREMGEVQCLL